MSDVTISATEVPELDTAGDVTHAEWLPENANHSQLAAPSIAVIQSGPKTAHAFIAGLQNLAAAKEIPDVTGNISITHYAKVRTEEAARIDGIKMPFRITPRQKAVSYWLVQGKTRSEIAIILNIRTHTVGDHVKEIYAKAVEAGASVSNKIEFANLFAQHNPELVDEMMPRVCLSPKLNFEQKLMLQLVSIGKTDPEIATALNAILAPGRTKSPTAVADYFKRFINTSVRAGLPIFTRMQLALALRGEFIQPVEFVTAVAPIARAAHHVAMLTHVMPA